MRYATIYDVGRRKRAQDGINEDSVAVSLLEDGHREGYSPPGVNLPRTTRDGTSSPQVHGPGDDAADQEGPDVAGGEPAEPDDGAGGQIASEDEPAGDETRVYEESDPPAAPRDRAAGIFVLADGAGGEQAGDIASYIATTVIPEELSGPVHRARRRLTGGFGLDIEAGEFGDPPDDDEIEGAIEDAIVAANEKIVAYARAANLDGIYTTVVVGVYLGDRLYYGWVGDSRIYVINERHGRIDLLTKDHAKVTRWEEEGRLDEIEAHVHPDGNEISRALGGSAGTDPDKAAQRARQDVETRNVQLFREDRVLLTSDGLIDAQTDAPALYREYVGSGHDDEVGEEVLDAVVTDDLIRDVVLEAQSLEAAANEYVSLSNGKGGKDNVSIVLFADEALPASPDPEVSALPERSVDPATPLEDRRTVIR